MLAAGDDGRDSSGEDPGSARSLEFPLPLGPGNIEALEEEAPAVSVPMGDDEHTQETPAAASAPSVAVVEYDDDERLPEDGGDASPQPEPMWREAEREIPTDAGEGIEPAASWPGDGVAADDPLHSPPLRADVAAVALEDAYQQSVGGLPGDPQVQAAQETIPIAPGAARGTSRFQFEPIPYDDEPKTPAPAWDERSGRQSTMEPMISDWADDRVTDVPGAARAAAAAATYRTNRPQRATRGLRPIPRPVARKGRALWILVSSAVLIAAAVLGFVLFDGAGRAEPEAVAAEVVAPPVAATVDAPPTEAPLADTVAATGEVAVPAPAEAAPVEAEPQGAIAAEPAPEAAPVAEAAHSPHAEPPPPPGSVALPPTPPAQKAFLRCPPNTCQRFGDLVMVNRGPLKLYADANCKKPIPAMFASGQTVVATGTDCFAVELPR